MKKYLFYLGTFLILSANAHAKSNGWSIGPILGDPVALTAEKELAKDRSVDLGLGYSWGHSFLFYGDYLLHFPSVFSTNSDFVNEWTPYVGVGPAFRFFDSDHKKRISDRDAQTVFSMRIPLGLGWHIPDAPLRVFVELVPLLNLIPGLDADLNGGVGIRIYF